MQNKKILILIFVISGSFPHSTAQANADSTQGNSFQEHTLYKPKAITARTRLLQETLMGDHSAKRRLLDIYEEDAGSGNDNGRDIAILKQAAVKGNVFAMEMLGDVYAQGLSVPIQPETAMKWYLKAAHRGYSWSLRLAIELYGKGEFKASLYEELHQLTENLLSKNERKENLTRLLASVAQRGDLAKVRDLLSKGVETRFDDYFESPLSKPLEKGDVPIVRELITHGGKLPDDIYRRALRRAIYDKYPELFHYLLPLRKQKQDQLLDYLTSAIYNNDLKSFKYLIQHGVDVAQTDDCGCPLQFPAAGVDSPEFAEILLQKGLSLNSRNTHQETPLFFAAENKAISVLDWLIAHGAIVDAVDQNGNTPLFKAFSAGLPQNANLLLAKGANPSHLNQLGETALFAAARNSSPGFLEALNPPFQNLFNMNAQNKLGNTAMHVALLSDRPTLAQSLWHFHADLTIRNQAGQTAKALILQKLQDYGPAQTADPHWLRPGSQSEWDRHFEKLMQWIQERQELIANMHRFQTIVETYAVDWGGVYSKSIEDISRAGHAKGRDYWKDLLNPITGHTGLSETLLQSKRQKPSAMDTGKVYYAPEVQASGVVAKYWIYGIDHRGEFLKRDNQVLALSNS